MERAQKVVCETRSNKKTTETTALNLAPRPWLANPLRIGTALALVGARILSVEG